MDTSAEDARLNRARRAFGLPPSTGAPAVPLAGDVGQRRYFRVSSRGHASVLLVLYPSPASAAQSSWREIGGALAEAGVRVPELLDDAPDLGAALVEDLGDVDLAAEIRSAPPEDRPGLLDEAERLLDSVRAVDPDAARRNPPFDAAFFSSELLHTRLWLLEAGGERPLPEGEAQRWDRDAGELARAAADAAAGRPVPTHRDFHANNLLRAADGRLAAIDFQDLRLGPSDYDPVSLRFERAGALVPDDGSAWSEAVLLQRAWKVLGTFEKMLAKGREIYRPHRNTAVAVIRRHTRPSGPFAPLLAFLPPA